MKNGFSLLELIVTLALISISSLVSISSVSYFVEKQKVIADTLAIASLKELARSNSISQRHKTSICGFNNNQCSKDWRNIAVIAQSNSQQTQLLANYQLSANYTKVLWSSFQNKKKLSFNPLGFTLHQNGTLYLCHAKHPLLHRALAISKSGKLRLIKQSGQLSKRCQ